MKLTSSLFISSLLGIAASLSADILPSPTFDAGDYTIHKSCNATEKLQLRRGLSEMVLLAEHARSHILEHGNSSKIYQKYFGNSSAAEPAGWYDRVVNAKHSDVVFRCDDPDKNCATQEGWAGHWRGSNATQETVICDISFSIRRNLDSMCAHGYNVKEGETNFYFASDLLHRVFHVPSISLKVVSHFSEDYDEILENAEKNLAVSVKDSDTLSYFALEVFSYVVFPGKGCPGPAKKVTTTLPSMTSSTASASKTAAKTTMVTKSATSSASDSCHTHADGEVHC